MTFHLYQCISIGQDIVNMHNYWCSFSDKIVENVQNEANVCICLYFKQMNSKDDQRFQKIPKDSKRFQKIPKVSKVCKSYQKLHLYAFPANVTK